MPYTKAAQRAMIAPAMSEASTQHAVSIALWPGGHSESSAIRVIE